MTSQTRIIIYTTQDVQTKHTDLSCHTGSLPELKAWTTSIGLQMSTSASVLLYVSGGGYRYYAKCETVLREIYHKMNMRNCGYSAKWRQWWLMFHGWRHLQLLVSCSYLLKRSFEQHVPDVKNIAGDHQVTLSDDQNSAAMILHGWWQG